MMMMIILMITMMMIGLFSGVSALELEEDPLLKEKLKTFMAKSRGDFISLNDFMGFIDENSVTEKEEEEFLDLGGGNVSYARVILKVKTKSMQSCSSLLHAGAGVQSEFFRDRK